MKDLHWYLLLFMYLHGIVLAEGFWLTVAALVAWPYSLYLSLEKILSILGMV